MSVVVAVVIGLDPVSLVMDVEVYQRGGVLGLDRRCVVREGTIEVIDRGRSRGARDLDPDQAARIDSWRR